MESFTLKLNSGFMPQKITLLLGETYGMKTTRGEKLPETRAVPVIHLPRGVGTLALLLQFSQTVLEELDMLVFEQWPADVELWHS